MESPQSVVSPLMTSSMNPEPGKLNRDHFTKNPTSECTKTSPPVSGVLEVYIHQARDIHNICIYHKQDVYAKICFTSNPEKSVTTQTINGGGQNPVFNQSLLIDVPTIDSSLKCEIFMLSRVRNYLEDQLLGFALIPLSEVLIKNGKLEKEFSLSSNDLFHSPSGFVQLSLSYNGVLPDVIAIPPPKNGALNDSEPPRKNGALNDSEAPISDQCELDKLEFPDPNIANENQMMVSEYFGISSESLVSSDTDDQASSECGAPFVFDTRKPGSPPTSVSTNGSQCASVPTESTESANQESDSPLIENPVKAGSISDSATKPTAALNLDLDQKVVQQDFVDLYMKSMLQFTESLAKMKLPLDMETEQTSSGNSSSDQTPQTPNGSRLQTPNGTRPRVFYGSRAFF